MNRRILIGLLLGIAHTSACPSALSAQVRRETPKNVSGGELQADQACFDVQHYDLSLDVRPKTQTIEGRLTMQAKATVKTSSIRLDLENTLTVRSVSIDGAAVQFRHQQDKIQIPTALKPDTVFRVTINYGGKPRIAPRPPWSGGFTWKQTKAGLPWIATSCQGEGADIWWPCKDHPSDKPDSMDLHISVPANLYCASNGKLISDTKKSGKRHFHWRVSTPISNYCVALNIAPYKVLKKKFKSVAGDTFDAFFFCLPESLADAKKAFPHFLDHVRHMEEICGPYPFRADKYAIVETPHLGMEHQSIIAYGNHYRLDKDGYDWLHHHEMCHEWWANLVTCRDWKDMWIHEGIGTYMQALYLEKARGMKAYRDKMRVDSLQIRNRAPIAPREIKNTQEIQFATGGNEIYMKGSWVMHTMRWLMGDEKFFLVLRRMAYPDPAMEASTDGSAIRFSDTEEIRAIAEKHYGKDLSWFFEVYTRSAGLPRLIKETKDGHLHLEWQCPVDGVVFPMPVQVEINGKLTRVEMPSGKASIAIRPKDKINVDPHRWILKRRTRTRNR
jgi:aminopeptidase N